MLLQAMFEQFCKSSPVTVMTRSTLEYALAPEWIDALCDRTAQSQYTRELTWSTVVDLTAPVVCGVHGSVRAAYLKSPALAAAWRLRCRTRCGSSIAASAPSGWPTHSSHGQARSKCAASERPSADHRSCNRRDAKPKTNRTSPHNDYSMLGDGKLHLERAALSTPWDPPHECRVPRERPFG